MVLSTVQAALDSSGSPVVFALQEGGIGYRWKSAAIIATLTLTGCSWIAFGI